jgi:hypothetical protein
MIEEPNSWLTWEMVKMLRVPVDSEVIRNTNPAQSIWYAFMFNKDRENVFENKLNMTEYLASFINGEAVRQIKDARKNQKVVSDVDFDHIIRKNFGRDLSPEAIEGGIRAEAQEVKPVIQDNRRGGVSIDDIKKYTGMELDEVKYTPYKK